MGDQRFPIGGTTILTFLTYNWAKVLNLTLGHIELSLYAVGIALVLGVPLGILCRCFRPLATIILGVTSIIYTIPTLALFGLMIPVLGIGVVPAIVAVVLYSLLPIVQNTYTGLSAVPPDVREAATGIGMGFGARLLRVELPMALGVIFAGIRIAVVNAVGMVTLASLIGAEKAFVGGVLPFLIGDAIKLVLAALLAKGVLAGASRFARL